MKVYYFENGKYITLNNVDTSFVINETNNEILDTGMIKVEDNDINKFHLMQSIKLVESDVFEKYFIIADIDKDYDFVNDSFLFIISLIEPTKYLEKVICPLMSFTNERDGLITQIYKMLINIEMLEENKNPRFEMSADFMNKIQDVNGADFIFDRGATLREVLDSMLEMINHRVIIKELTDSNNVVLDLYDLNERNNLIDFRIDSEKARFNRNLGLLGSEIISYGDNALITIDRKNKKTIYHPSKVGWTTFATTEATLTTSNAMIYTTYPIEEIESFVAKVDFKISAPGAVGPVVLEKNNYELEMGANVIDRELYEVLEEKEGENINVRTDELYKTNTIYYEKGSSTIKGDRHTKLLFFKTQNILYAVKNAIFHLDEVQYIYDDGAVNINIDVSINIANFIFRINYIPQVDLHLAISKEDYENNLPKTQIINQHGATQIDSLRYGDNLYGLINRLGNEEVLIDKTIDIVKTFDWGLSDENFYNQAGIKYFVVNKNNLSSSNLPNPLASGWAGCVADSLKPSANKIFYQSNRIDTQIALYELGDFTIDNYVLIERSLSFNHNFIKAQYKFSKNFNALSSKIGIDRSKRIYNIPLNYLTADTLIKEYILVGTTINQIDSLIIYEIVKIADKSLTTNPLTNVFLRTKFDYGNYSDFFEFPLISYSAGLTINFAFKFLDNYSAGISIGGRVLGGREIIYNPYVDKNGEYEKISLALFSDDLRIPATDNAEELLRARELPKVDIDRDYNYEDMGLPFIKTFKKYKDRLEHHAFTISFELKSVDEDIILAEAFARDNPLWNDVDFGLEIYASENDIYFKGDKLPKGVKLNSGKYTIRVGVGYIQVSFTNGNYKSWSLANELGELYLGVNNIKKKRINFQMG